MKIIKYILTLIVLSFLSSCVDIFHKTYWSEENYEVVDNPGKTSCKTLYFKLENGAGIGRVNFISRIGSNNSFIIAESIEEGIIEYWILNKEKDNKYYNANEIIEGPFDINTFNKRKEELEIIRLDFGLNLE